MNASFEHTRNYAQYRQYCGLKQNWKVNYKDINLADACAIDLIDAIVVGHKASYYHIICALFQRIQVAPLKDAFETHTNIFTFAFPNRKDHLALSKAYVSSVDDSRLVVLDYYYSPRKSISRWLHFWKEVRTLPISFINRVFSAARMAGYSGVIDDLEKQFASVNLNTKQFIPFCATVYHEALLTLFFRSKGATTYYTFHGVFGRYLQFIANDVVNGDNILSNYVLAFGEGQRQDLIHDFEVNPNIIKVAGNPKYPYHKIQIQNTFQSCLILGGAGMYDDALRQLLLEADKLADQLQIKMALKPHPLSKIYEDAVWKQIKHITLLDKSDTITSLFDTCQYDFAITHNTSSYYECMIAGLKPFRWGNNENVDFEGMEDRFYTAEQLERMIRDAKQTDSAILSQEAEQLLIHVIGYGINNYNQIINASLE